jgi:hypothetical protein
MERWLFWLQQQVGKWGSDPSTVRAITYDANGNVYFGLSLRTFWVIAEPDSLRSNLAGVQR